MIVLDTNIISELMRPRQSASLLEWLNVQPASSLFLTVTTFHELLFGIERMPTGRRRTVFENTYAEYKSVHFRGRILSIDLAAAENAARYRARRLDAGMPLSEADSLIAGTAAARGFAVATRNTQDFDGLGLTLINPFEPEPA